MNEMICDIPRCRNTDVEKRSFYLGSVVTASGTEGVWKYLDLCNNHYKFLLDTAMRARKLPIEEAEKFFDSDIEKLKQMEKILERAR